MNKKVPYKYVVQYGNRYSSYQEYIHDLPVKDTCNRCLELGNRTDTEKGTYMYLYCMYCEVCFYYVLHIKLIMNSQVGLRRFDELGKVFTLHTTAW